MCGRFMLVDNAEVIAQVLGFPFNETLSVRYNISPSQNILVARHNEQDQGEFALLKWGLIPSWVKDVNKAHKPINAKAETINERPYFRVAFKKRRCLIPTNGFYEWKPEGKIKQPFLIHRPGNELFFFAGLWEYWVSHDGEVIESATIVTTNANQTVAPIHCRMPVILSKKDYEPWLDINNTDSEFLLSMLLPAPNEMLEALKVSTLVNSPKNDNPHCVEPVQD
jgi:putative SOS response-associated peptidase YedK